jgi:hypothetical protein
MISDLSTPQIGRIYEGIKLNEEELKNYKQKLDEAKKSENNLFQILKEIKKNNLNNNNIDENSIGQEEINIISENNNKRPLKDLENNEIKLLSPTQQNEILMFFIPDIINSTYKTICDSCKERGHSKEQCIQFPDPNYDRSLKYCMNCGKNGHLYCRKGIKDDNIDEGSEEDDESPDPVALSRKKPITIHEMKYLKFFFIPLILQLNI